jgi:hypothetical protein
MRVKLLSDFYDYYDCMLDLDGEVMTRFSVNELSRLDMFHKMLGMGLVVPIFGEIFPYKNEFRLVVPCNYGWSGRSVKFNMQRMPTDHKMVVYNDVYAHRGMGKELIEYRDAGRYLYKTASLYIPGWGEYPRSYRYLRVGNLEPITLQYTSYSDDWRSNVGDVDIEIIPNTLNIDIENTESPLMAIDFVKDREDNLFAVDYNTSPGLRWTGIEDIYSATTIANSIREWYEVRVI